MPLSITLESKYRSIYSRWNIQASGILPEEWDKDWSGHGWLHRDELSNQKGSSLMSSWASTTSAQASARFPWGWHEQKWTFLSNFKSLYSRWECLFPAGRVSCQLTGSLMPNTCLKVCNTSRCFLVSSMLQLRLFLSIWTPQLWF